MLAQPVEWTCLTVLLIAIHATTMLEGSRASDASLPALLVVLTLGMVTSTPMTLGQGTQVDLHYRGRLAWAGCEMGA